MSLSSGEKHGLRRIARLTEAQGTREANPLWQAYSTILERIVDPGDAQAQEIEELAHQYTATRLTAHADNARDALVRHLPSPLSELPSAQLGYVEADVLQWLLSDTPHRVLSVIGTKGVGKSSLLHYVLRCLPTHVPYLRDVLWPIILDVREEPRVSTELAVFNLLLRNLENRFAADEEIRQLVTPQHWTVLPEFFAGNYGADMNHPDVARRLLDGLINCLCRIAGKRKVRLVLVFDNLDQLPPSHTARVLALARSLSISFSIRIIVALRPFSLRAQLERDFDMGAFVTTNITVRPPDLRALLTGRIRYWLDNPAQKLPLHLLPFGKSLSLDIGPLARSLNRLLTYFASVRLQEHLLRDLCNNDTRRGLRALKSFLRYRRLPVSRFSEDVLSATKADFSRHRAAQYHLLNGIMIDDFRYYREELSHGNNIVLNLFDVNRKPMQGERVVQYYVLTLLRWKGTHISLEALAAAFRGVFGHEVICGAAQRLLKAGLLESPNHDEVIDDKGVIGVSSTGTYYMDELVQNPDYIYNVVYDTHLHHRAWSAQRHDFAAHVDSICELFEAVCDEELHVVAGLEKNMAKAAVSSVAEFGMLGDRIAFAMERLGKSGSVSEHGDVKQAAFALDRYLQSTGAQLRRQLRVKMMDARHTLGVFEEQQLAEHRISVGALGELSVRHSTSADESGRIEVGLEWRPGHEVLGSGRLIAMIQPESGVRPAKGDAWVVQLGNAKQTRMSLQCSGEHYERSSFAKVLVVRDGMGLASVEIGGQSGAQ